MDDIVDRHVLLLVVQFGVYCPLIRMTRAMVVDRTGNELDAICRTLKILVCEQWNPPVMHQPRHRW